MRRGDNSNAGKIKNKKLYLRVKKLRVWEDTIREMLEVTRKPSRFNGSLVSIARWSALNRRQLLRLSTRASACLRSLI